VDKINIREILKSLTSLDVSYGKKLVTAVYYALTAVIAVSMLCSFIMGIAEVATGSVLVGLGKILFCVPLAIVNLLVLRLLCEIANNLFKE